MKPLPYDRRKQILTLLAHHDPLSVRGLIQMLEPSPSPRRLRDSLARLFRSGLVTRRNHGLFGNAAIYYQIAHNRQAQIQVSKITEINADVWNRNHPRTAELLHWEECAVFTRKLKTFLPDSKIIREHEFKHHPEVNEYLLGALDDPTGAKPDIVAVIEPGLCGHSSILAIKIERTLKSKERLKKKLDFYANRTVVDGLIYVCADDEIVRAIELMYRSKKIIASLRVGHYGNLFLMFMDRDAILKKESPVLFNSDFKHVGLSKWIELFKQVPLPKRRNLSERLQPSAAEGLDDEIKIPKPENKNEIQFLDDWD